MNKLYLSLLLLLLLLSLSLSSQEWRTDFGDSIYFEDPWGNTGYGSVEASSIYNGKLVLGGYFTKVGDLWVNGIAAWDSTSWTAFGVGMDHGPALRGMEEYNNYLYIAGAFSEVGGASNSKYIARWTGTQWGGGLGVPGSSAYSLKEYNGQLYMGGGFGNISGIPASYIAAYDGTIWSPLGIGTDLIVCVMEVYNNELYAGGYFYSAGGLANTRGIARWDGSQWQNVGGGVNSDVTAFCVDSINNLLYVGGYFNTAGVQDSVYNVAVWDGQCWMNLGTGLNCGVYTDAMALYRGDLYVGGGCITQAGEVPVNNIARWDGQKWDSLESGTNSAVFELITYKDELYVGGPFEYAGGQRAYGLARWYMPPGYNCNMLKPRVFCDTDTAYLDSGTATVQFQNNNAHSDLWIWDFGDTGTASVQNPTHTFTDTGNYNVCVTVKYEGCEKTACNSITVLNGTSIDEFSGIKESFRIFPNPTKGSIQIECTIENIHDCYVEITDIKGAQIKTMALETGQNKLSLDTTSWSAGTYICKLIHQKRTILIKKIVVAE